MPRLPRPAPRFPTPVFVRRLGSLVVLLVLAFGAATDPAAAKMTKALQDTRLVMSDDPAERARFWDRVEQARVGRVRVLTTWDGVARRIDATALLRLRRAAEDAEDAGAELVVGIYAPINRAAVTPRRITSRNIRDFAAFAGSLGAGLRDEEIAGYLTWNEPNFKSMWPQDQPRTWVRMSNAGYRAFKRSDPGTPVLVGETAPNARTSNAVDPGVFFRRALCLDSRWRPRNASRTCRTRLLGDGIALHVHDFTHAPTTPRASKDAWTIGNLPAAMTRIRAMARAGRITRAASRNVHITEFAYRTHGSSRTPDARAARWLRDAWRLAQREGVRSFSWYQLQDPGLGNEWRSGLITDAAKPRRTWQTFRYLR